MDKFNLLAAPIWVNFLILIPILLFFYWRKSKLSISRKTLLYTLIFGIAFGAIEASCVIYLRAANGFLPGYQGTIQDVWKQSELIYYDQELLRRSLPMSLLLLEVIREAGTLVMLSMIAFISAPKIKERFAIFVWTFAVWDIFYYVYLWISVHWPQSFMTKDVLFLIPQPWLSQVWFTLVVSSISLLAVFINIKSKQE